MSKEIDFEKLHRLLQIQQLLSTHGTQHGALMRALASELREMNIDAQENARAAEAKVA